MTATTMQRSKSISLRALPAQKELIMRACQTVHKSFTDFMLEVACREAENILCDQRYFQLDEDAFNAFEKALDAPLSENTKLQRLLAKKSPWEE